MRLFKASHSYLQIADCKVVSICCAVSQQCKTYHTFPCTCYYVNISLFVNRRSYLYLSLTNDYIAIVLYFWALVRVNIFPYGLGSDTSFLNCSYFLLICVLRSYQLFYWLCPSSLYYITWIACISTKEAHIKHMILDFIKVWGEWLRIDIVAIEANLWWSSKHSCFYKPFVALLLSFPSLFLRWPVLPFLPSPQSPTSPAPFPSLLGTSLVMVLVSLSLFTQAPSVSSTLSVYLGISLYKDISFPKGNTTTNFWDVFDIVGRWKMIFDSYCAILNTFLCLIKTFIFSFEKINLIYPFFQCFRLKRCFQM